MSPLLAIILLGLSPGQFPQLPSLPCDQAAIERKVVAMNLDTPVPASPPDNDVPGVHLSAIELAASQFHSGDEHLDRIFKQALLNTQKQAKPEPDNTTYLQTGDLHRQWLRDSAAQVRPYLYFAEKPEVKKFLSAVIQRQAGYILSDPYADSFAENYSVSERKYELDSLCYPVGLAWQFWKRTNDSSVFTDKVKSAFDTVLSTMQTEQDHEASSNYTFPSLPNHGKGNPVAKTGMIWTGFRPSDDDCKYNYLIPSEMMAVVTLGQLADIEDTVYHDSQRAAEARKLAEEVNQGIQKYGVVDDPKFGKIYAYEVDGLGHVNEGDDANVPSLLSAPYLGYLSVEDPVYQNTRRAILSKSNPNYFQGTFAQGIGSVHTPKGYVWPLALVMQGLTSTSAEEKKTVVKELLDSDPGDNRLHESFDPSHPTTLTRPDFGWPNALFAEMVMLDWGIVKPLPMPPLPMPPLPKPSH